MRIMSSWHFSKLYIVSKYKLRPKTLMFVIFTIELLPRSKLNGIFGQGDPYISISIIDKCDRYTVLRKCRRCSMFRLYVFLYFFVKCFCILISVQGIDVYPQRVCRPVPFDSLIIHYLEFGLGSWRSPRAEGEIGLFIDIITECKRCCQYQSWYLYYFTLHTIASILVISLSSAFFYNNERIFSNIILDRIMLHLPVMSCSLML